MKRFAYTALALLSVGAILLSACGGASGAPRSAASSAAAAPAAPAMYDSADTAAIEESGEFATEISLSPEAPNPALANRKIIKHSQLSLETLEFDEALAQITTMTEQSGGYIENLSSEGRSMYNQHDAYMRYATIVARIPSDRIESAVNKLSELYNVTSRSDRIEDISETYFDSQARMKSLEVQERTLLDILSKADKLEDVVTLQRELSQVRYEIEAITASLRRMDNQVSFSYLNIDLQEVSTLQPVTTAPKTFSDEMAASASRSMQNISQTLRGLVLFMIEAIPMLVISLLIIAIPAGVVLLIVRAVHKRGVKKRARQQAALKSAADQTPPKE